MKIRFFILILALFTAMPFLCAEAAIEIDNIDDLQKIGVDPAFPLNGNYVLTQDIDASSTSSWNSGAGFIPIGDQAFTMPAPFTGVLDGQGYAISNLFIDRQYDFTIATALIAMIDGGGALKNLRLTDCQITGNYYTGSLAGVNQGTVSGCEVSGSVRHLESSDMSMGAVTGGLVGSNGNSGVLQNCSMSGEVVQADYFSGSQTDAAAGGIAGTNTGTLDQCHSEAALTGYYYTGGLVGRHDAPSDATPTGVALTPGSITGCSTEGVVNGKIAGGLAGCSGVENKPKPFIVQCRSSAVVEGEFSVGGLIGENRGHVRNSSAEGDVTGSRAGGLIGDILDGSEIYQCQADGNVEGNSTLGGFAGASANAAIHQSFATGNVTASDGYAGGFIGNAHSSTIEDCYAWGNVTAVHQVAGFATAFDSIIIKNCYSIGHVTETGFDPHWSSAYGFSNEVLASVTACFWDIETSGMDSSLSGEGLDTAAMQQKVTYTDVGWDMDNLWGITENASYPCLRWSSPLCGQDRSLSVVISGRALVKTKPGSAHTFQAVVSNAEGAVSYEWHFENDSSGVIPDAHGAIYEIPYISEVHDGLYHCVVHDDLDTAVSKQVRLMVTDQLPVSGIAVLFATTLLLAALGAYRMRCIA